MAQDAEHMAQDAWHMAQGTWRRTQASGIVEKGNFEKLRVWQKVKDLAV